jgi:predicted phosphate transport protein (TIGR00153 family)
MSILQPRNDHFYQLFERAAATMRRGAELLLAMLNDYTDIAVKAKTIKDVEHDGDTLTHEMYELLNRIFVTPLDREDIAALASALDDILDLVEASADDYVVCGIEAPLPAAVEMAQIILQSAVKVQEAFSYLAHLSKERTAVRALLEEINRLENEGDNVYRAAMQALFAQPDAVQIVKWKQIYDHMERAVDSCEDVADVLHGVLLKYA